MRVMMMIMMGSATLSLAGCPRPQPKTTGVGRVAELVLKNGVIFTARSETDVVEALAIAGGKVIAIGSMDDVERLVGEGTRSIDLHGRFVTPGFHDAHVHFESGGRSLATLNVYGERSFEALLAAVKREAVRRPRGEWIIGRGWDHTLWSGQRWPTRQDLDRVAPDHPVHLTRADGHAVWVNSKALALAKISGRTPDPPGGEIVREAGSRRPSGVLKENALKLVEPTFTPEQRRRYLELALGEAKRHGVTSVQELGASLAQLERLDAEGKLSARVLLWGELDGDLDAYAAARKKHPIDAERLIFGGVKGFVDGTLGSGTAALLEPYADTPGQTGTLNYRSADLKAKVAAANARGFQVYLHAIGDRAVREALDAYQSVADAGGGARRHRIEHVQMVHRDDLPRFARIGVIASIQPCHLITDQRWVEKRLGGARAAERGYLWRELKDAGARLALGTDWPVEPLDPLRNLYAAVARKRMPPNAGDGWHDDQALSVGAALLAYTRGAAYAAHLEQRRGTLLPGQDADLTLIDRNLFTIAPDELLRAKVLATMVGGAIVYGSLE